MINRQFVDFKAFPGAAGRTRRLVLKEVEKKGLLFIILYLLGTFLLHLADFRQKGRLWSYGSCDNFWTSAPLALLLFALQSLEKEESFYVGQYIVFAL